MGATCHHLTRTLALALLGAAIGSASCATPEQRLVVTNHATEPIAVAWVMICDQFFRFEAIHPGQKQSPSASVQRCEGGYVIDVRFESGRRHQRQVGYVTADIDLRDEIVVTDASIDVRSTGPFGDRVDTPAR